MRPNKKRALTLAGKVAFYSIIISLSISSVYLHKINSEERLRMESEIKAMKFDIKALQDSNAETRQQLNELYSQRLCSLEAVQCEGE